MKHPELETQYYGTEQVECICGAMVVKRHMEAHVKTKRHCMKLGIDEYIKCECGKTVFKNYYAEHMRTKRHQPK